MGESKKVFYLSGPITGVPNFWEPFEEVDDQLSSKGFIVLNPARLPQGMTPEQYMIINIGNINAADAVIFLPGWENSKGAKLERIYCEYIGKEVHEWSEISQVLSLT